MPEARSAKSSLPELPTIQHHAKARQAKPGQDKTRQATPSAKGLIGAERVRKEII